MKEEKDYIIEKLIRLTDSQQLEINDLRYEVIKLKQQILDILYKEGD